MNKPDTIGKEKPLDTDPTKLDSLDVGEHADQEKPNKVLPSKIGRYTPTKLLGKGGMAEVFLAEQDGPAGFKKSIVIKRILPELLKHKRFIELFLREARLAARLNHTNIVQINELAEDQGQYFIAMEYIDGISLHQMARVCWHRGQSLPMDLILSAIADAALALHYAHTFTDSEGKALHLVHRDVSPDNLMINREGVTKVLDFGVARGEGALDHGGTYVGELKGKLPFMSPEQVRNEEDIDGRADLFGLGVCLYWLLTGHRPHKGSTQVATIDAITNQAAVPPRKLNPLIAPDLELLIMQLIAKKREFRIATGEELHDLLRDQAPTKHRDIVRFVEQVIKWSKHPNATKGPHRRGKGFVPSQPSVTFRGRPYGQPEDYSPVTPSDVANRAISTGGVGASGFSMPGHGPEVAAMMAEDDEEWLLESEVTGTEQEENPARDLLQQLKSHPGPEPELSDEIELPKHSWSRRWPQIAIALAIVIGSAVITVYWLTKQEPKTDQAGNTVAPNRQRDTSQPAALAPANQTSPDATQHTPPQPVVVAATRPDATTPGTAKSKVARTVKPKVARPVQIEARGPAHIKWLGPKKQPLGQGSTLLTLPSQSRYIFAHDSKRKVLTKVRLRGTEVNYNRLPKGTLSIRAYPYATVYLGGEKIGTTPFSPLQVVAGTYKVTLIHNNISKVVTTKVTAGQSSQIKIRMVD